MDLQLLQRPEYSNELALLEDLVGPWKHGGRQAFEAKRVKERQTQLMTEWRLRGDLSNVTSPRKLVEKLRQQLKSEYQLRVKLSKMK